MIARANKSILKLGKSEPGLDAVEYFLIAGMVTLAAIAWCVTADVQLIRTFTTIGDGLALALKS